MLNQRRERSKRNRKTEVESGYHLQIARDWSSR
jgi:hypothetical protein